MPTVRKHVPQALINDCIATNLAKIQHLDSPNSLMIAMLIGLLTQGSRGVPYWIPEHTAILLRELSRERDVLTRMISDAVRMPKIYTE